MSDRFPRPRGRVVATDPNPISAVSTAPINPSNVGKAKNEKRHPTRLQHPPKQSGAAASPRRKPEKRGDDYEVGYCRPPKHTRFQKGRPGNPNGRPKKSKGRKTILRDVFERPVKIQRDGKTVTMTSTQVIYEQLRQQAMQGNLKAALAVNKLLTEAFGPAEEDGSEVASATGAPMNAEDLKAYAYFQADRLREEGLDDGSVAKVLRVMGLSTLERDAAEGELE